MRTLSRFALVASLVVAPALGGCTLVSSGDPPDSDPRAADVTCHVIDVPIVRQRSDFSCGDVTTLSILRYWQYDAWAKTPEDALYAALHSSPENGTDPQPIADFLNGAGLHAEYRTDVALADLLAAVDRGEPPIVDFQAWQSTPADWSADWTDGHYGVLVGYDAENLFFMDPSVSAELGYLPRAALEARWHDIVGTESTHYQHMAIFVRGDGRPTVPPRVMPRRAAPID